MSGSSVLDSNVLVLNRFYMAIRIVNVRRAMTLLYRDCAEVILLDQDQYISYDFNSWCELSQLMASEKQPGDEYLSAVNFELRVPRIVRLTRFERVLSQTVRFNRKNLFARDNYCCQYCGQTHPPHKLSLDHVVPRSHGGQATWENIVCCCLKCNGRKGGRTPQQARMKLLSRPVRPRFNPLMTEAVEDPRYQCWKTFLTAN